MPCYTIRKTPVVFENIAYKPSHMLLMIEAIQEMGFVFLADLQGGVARELTIWPAGSVRTAENTIRYRGGKFEVPSTLGSRFSLDRLKEAYSRQAIKFHARRNGWLVRELSGTEFEIVKR